MILDRAKPIFFKRWRISPADCSSPLARTSIYQKSQRTLDCFIDALDEKRSGRSDQVTIDLLVQKLFRDKPQAVRLACREQDWLDETDLATLRPYFDGNGGAFVVALEPLTESEQIDLLAERGVADPASFVQQARQRRLDNFLDNPQNLVMLTEAVQAGEWPTSLSELFEMTSALLLAEHNRERTRRGRGVFAAAELRPAAGAACALRLVSDVDAISLSEGEGRAGIPSYRTTPFYSPELTLAALSRRIFVAVGPEAVSYSHRTRAEYLGAEWLADHIRAGYPIGRVRALLGVEGIPAPELRGLHAWLAIHLRDLAGPLIDGDPEGILTYADVSALSLTNRAALIAALGRWSRNHPYHRSDEKASRAIAALSQDDMAPHFRAVLSSSEETFVVKTIVLDALRFGKILPELQADLISLLSDPSAPYGLKWPALKAACRIGGEAQEALVELYHNLGAEPDAIRLRSDVVTELYGKGLGPLEVAKLVQDALNSRSDLILGVLWRPINVIPIDQAVAVLNAIEPPVALASGGRRERRNSAEARQFIERLVVRLLNEGPELVTGQDIFRWSELRKTFGDYPSEREWPELKAIMGQRPELARQLFDAILAAERSANRTWLLARDLSQLLPYQLTDQPLAWIVEHLARGAGEQPVREELFSLALNWTYADVGKCRVAFERLYEMANTDPALQAVRSHMTLSAIEDWRREDAVRSATEGDERERGRNRTRLEFEANVSEIKTGRRMDWVLWLGDLYFANFTDVDSSTEPRERIERELGADNVPAAIEALQASLTRDDLPTLADIAEAEAANSYPRWWQALIAGMDELAPDGAVPESLTDNQLKTLIGISLVMPTTRREAGVIREGVHYWKDRLLRERPTLVKHVYVDIAMRAVRNGKEHVSGLYELLNNEALKSFRESICIQFLRNISTFHVRNLENLLQCALGGAISRRELLLLCNERLAQQDLSIDERRLWAAAGYLLAPNTFEKSIRDLDSPEIVWRLRALTGHDRQGRPSGKVPPPQLKFIASFVAGHFARASMPTGGWSGNENEWDASEYVLALINDIAADASQTASDSLRALLADPRLSTYEPAVRHALANQATRRREMAYEQPSWEAAILALKGGRPAHMEDLHALLLDHLADLKSEIATQNNDVYRQFWNEDARGKPTVPKNEESCRDVLLGMLRTRLEPLGVTVEPEGHMASDKRADIVAALPGKKSLIELKLDGHPAVWTAHTTQLERFYARDHEASGFGIYCVLWCGSKRRRRIPKRPGKGKTPQDAAEMQEILSRMIMSDSRARLGVAVIDVSGEIEDQSKRTVTKLRRNLKQKKTVKKRVRNVKRPKKRP